MFCSLCGFSVAWFRSLWSYTVCDCFFSFRNLRGRKKNLSPIILWEERSCRMTGYLTKGLTLVQALRSRVGAKGCWRIFFKNPTTQLHVVWGLTEKKCEQTPKFACFSVQRRPLHLSQAEMLPSHAVLKEGIKWRRPPPNGNWCGA